MLPPAPFVDAPVDIRIFPLAPELVVPEENVSDPLTPAVPVFGVKIFTTPGLTPKPAKRDIAPPV
jgi:hypothetical protein